MYTDTGHYFGVPTPTLKCSFNNLIFKINIQDFVLLLWCKSTIKNIYKIVPIKGLHNQVKAISQHP